MGAELLHDNVPVGLRRSESGDFYELGVMLGGLFFAIAQLKAPDVDEAVREAKAEADAAAAPAEPPAPLVPAAGPPAEPPAETAATPEPPAGEPQPTQPPQPPLA